MMYVARAIVKGLHANSNKWQKHYRGLGGGVRIEKHYRGGVGGVTHGGSIINRMCKNVPLTKGHEA